nr:hypothetical protein Iba_chr11aCG6040 [Ipomoea batatas]
MKQLENVGQISLQSIFTRGVMVAVRQKLWIEQMAVWLVTVRVLHIASQMVHLPNAKCLSSLLPHRDS